MMSITSLRDGGLLADTFLPTFRPYGTIRNLTSMLLLDQVVVRQSTYINI